jgi:hypothetical protein
MNLNPYCDLPMCLQEYYRDMPEILRRSRHSYVPGWVPHMKHWTAYCLTVVRW